MAVTTQRHVQSRQTDTHRKPIYGLLSAPGMTPQTQPLPGMVKNDASGYGYQTPLKTQVARWLVTGSETNTYYVTGTELTARNIAAVQQVLANGDGIWLVDTIVEISTQGRAIREQTNLLALALCVTAQVHPLVSHTRKNGTTYTTLDPQDVELRRYALKQLPYIARTLSQLEMFVGFIMQQQTKDNRYQLRGFGRSLKRGIADWFTAKPLRDLAFQVVKYPRRNHGLQAIAARDLLRLSHPVTTDQGYKDLFGYICKHWDPVGTVPHDNPALLLPWAKERIIQIGEAALADRPDALAALRNGLTTRADPFAFAESLPVQTDAVRQVADLVRTYRLPAEAVSYGLQATEVWQALYPNMGYTALIRNLGQLTAKGVLNTGYDTVRQLVQRLTDTDAIHKSRVHPMTILQALKTYASGSGREGKYTWTPSAVVIAALDTAFHTAFANVADTGLKWYVALDTSGSMWTPVTGMQNITCAEAGLTIAQLIAGTQANSILMSFEMLIRSLPILPMQSLTSAMQKLKDVSVPRNTDCSVPLRDAVHRRVFVDMFVIITDHQTYAGNQHVVEALRLYRTTINPNVRIATLSTDASTSSLLDPNDPTGLDIAGFDTHVPRLLVEHATATL